MYSKMTYPKITVVLCFGILGSLMGGLLAGTVTAVVLLMSGRLAADEFWKLFLGGVYVITVIGSIPAFGVGVYLAVKRFCIMTRADYYRVFVIGMIFTMIYAVMILTIFMWGDFARALLPAFGLAVACGLSAVMMARLALPKNTKDAV